MLPTVLAECRSDSRDEQGEFVILADGRSRGLQGLSVGELLQLQWEQERLFAQRIQLAPRGSAERSEAVREAYNCVPRIFAAWRRQLGKPVTMGLHPRHAILVRRLLASQRARGLAPRFFEIGFAEGTLLAEVQGWGIPVGGIEVSDGMHARTAALLGPETAGRLLLGSLQRCDLAGEPRPTLVYWNDVFEHIPPDEIGDYLKTIFDFLVPGGQLVTITPNWHRRPNDITCAFRPRRSVAEGLHLKEYTLSEVTSLLAEAGFCRVATPLVSFRKLIALWGDGMARSKRRLEPLLERLPFRPANLLARGLGLDCTIATKPA